MPYFQIQHTRLVVNFYSADIFIPVTFRLRESVYHLSFSFFQKKEKQQMLICCSPINWNLSAYYSTLVTYNCIKKNTNTLKIIITRPIKMNIMDVKLSEIGLST